MADQCLLAGVRKELVDVRRRDKIIEKAHGGRGLEVIWEISAGRRGTQMAKKQKLTTASGAPVPDGQPGLNYLCAGYKRFFEHSAPHFHVMAKLIEAGQPASKIMESEIMVVPPGFRVRSGRH